MEIPIADEYKPLVKSFHDKREFMRRGIKLPYVLFGFQCEQLEGPPNERKAVKKPAAFMLDCSSCSGQRAILEQYALQKGYTILEYDFPKGPEKEVGLNQFGVPRLANPDSFLALEQAIHGILAIDKVRILESKNKAMEDELASIKAQKSKKGNDVN